MSGKITDSANVASEPVISTLSHAAAIPFSQYLAALAAKYSKKVGFRSFGAGYPCELGQIYSDLDVLPYAEAAASLTGEELTQTAVDQCRSKMVVG